MKKLGMAVLALAALISTSAAARPRGGVVVVHRGYGGYGGGWYSPFYSPWGYGGPYMLPNAGEVKLETRVKDAAVYIDGAYAGTAGKLKSMYLKSGSYNIELRAPGLPPFAERVYVVPGKTVHLRPDAPGGVTR